MIIWMESVCPSSIYMRVKAGQQYYVGKSSRDWTCLRTSCLTWSWSIAISQWAFYSQDGYARIFPADSQTMQSSKLQSISLPCQATSWTSRWLSRVQYDDFCSWEQRLRPWGVRGQKILSWLRDSYSSSKGKKSKIFQDERTQDPEVHSYWPPIMAV